MDFDGIIFDIDGTLWDTTHTLSDSWNRTLKERYGYEGWLTPEKIAGIMGKTCKQIADILFNCCGDRAEEVCNMCLLDECSYVSSVGGELYPGLKEQFRTLSKQYPLFIVSNCQKGYIEAFLNFTGLSDCVTDFVSEGITGLEKAENIRLIMQRRRLYNAVYVGDTENDERSARQAGCAFIHACYGFGKAEHPDRVISSLTELPDVLKTI